MTQTIIIYAHPNKRGFCGEILRSVIQKITEQGHTYEIVDLYMIDYDPRLADREHYTSGGYEISEENKRFQKMIADAKYLIIIYPTWWQNMPAILKGFFDRVFTSRFAFRYVNNLPIGLLRGRRAIVLTSAGGPRAYSRFFTGDRAINVVVKDILRFCGIRAKGYGIGGARAFDEIQKGRIEKIVKKALRYLYS